MNEFYRTPFSKKQREIAVETARLVRMGYSPFAAEQTAKETVEQLRRSRVYSDICVMRSFEYLAMS